MADKNVWSGMDESSQVAVILELFLQEPTPAQGVKPEVAVQAKVDALTQAGAQNLRAAFDMRRKRAQWGA